ncbi:hypothetical protein ABIE87_006482 [Bradyrhizobium diazoefficiens]|uniref:hypothetical protein n=1 Tax=Bradyrhizobium diazoefficiens TaxID=1355477 RepID=UPI0035187772
MIHEKRHNLLENGFRKLDNEPRQVSDLLALVTLALFIGAAAIWIQIYFNATGGG